MERRNDYFSIDTSSDSIVRVEYHQTPTHEELEEYLSAMDAVLDFGRPRAFLLNATVQVTLNAAQRRRQADWVRTNRARLRQGCAGYAFVIPSTVGRGVLTAILWLQPLPVEHTVVATVSDAEVWCRAQLRSLDAI